MDIQQKIKEWITESLKIEGDFSVEHPKEMERGDYATSVALAEGKRQGKNPKEMAEEFVKILQDKKLPEIEKIEVAGPGFINFFLKPEFFLKQVMDTIHRGIASVENNVLAGQKIIIEYTDPNPFKEFHIGHLMSNTIGESISRLIDASGAEIKRACYQGDVGLQIAKAVWAMKKGISLDDAYAEGHKAYEENEESKKEIVEINKKIYDRSDKEINALYDKGRKESLDEFEAIYTRLGTHFDFYFFESKTGEFGKQVVKDNTPDVFEESEGAIVYKGEKYDPKLHTRVFINKDGLPTYEAKELGLAKIKYDQYAYDTSIVITGNEINEYFKVLLSALSKVFPDLAEKTKHISHGMMRLPEGKMSSRTGNIITAESLITDVKEKVLEKMLDREMTDEQKQATAEIVAIGAIKYSILRQAIGGDIIFDFDKSLSFEGDSGPYLQYAYVRACSVLKKGISLSETSGNFAEVSLREIPGGWQTTNVERMIARFGEVVDRAGREYAPHHIVTYLVELASTFNNFYAEHKIADENDPTSPYRLALTESFSIVMKKGLDLLGIKVPEEM